MNQSLLSIARPLVERFPRVASIYRALRDQLTFVAEPLATPWGFRLGGNAAMSTGAFELEETELVRRLLAEVDVLVNIGANVGYYCCHALSLGKSVIAFEPMSSNVRHLCSNIDTNGWSCEIFPLALSNDVGILKIFGGGTGASLVKGWSGTSDRYYTLVPCSSLDKVLGTRLADKKVLIIIDVEGAEELVLQGAQLLLANNPKPIWFIEITTSTHQPNDMGINPHLTTTFRRMFEAGYDAFTANREMRRITAEDVAAAQAGDASTLTTHNFIFRGTP